MKNRTADQHLFPIAVRSWAKYWLLVMLNLSATAVADINSVPQLAHAQVYRPGINVNQYWVSEKLDGVRAYWDGQHLLSRSGNRYHAPAWFTKGFPSQALDGELWIGRNRFELLISTVRKHVPEDDAWKKVKYMVFDLPDSKAVFSARLEQLQRLLQHLSATLCSPYLRMVPQDRVESHTALMQKLNTITQRGGEGLMLHRADAFYRAGRNGDLLKLKRHQDAEAKVIAHLPGKGKYRNMLGSLLVETDAGKRFRLGSGFTDPQRKNPPPIGALVTYKYYGKTRNGLPRFASFVRIRTHD